RWSLRLSPGGSGLGRDPGGAARRGPAHLRHRRMSRRARAAIFLALALLAAAAAAAVVAGYGSSVARGYGPLRPVVVLEASLPAGRPIGPREVASSLGVRRVPERFVPAGALAVPGDALGLV